MTIPWLALLVPLLEHWYIKTEALSFLYDDMDIISINNWTGNTVSLLTFCGGVNNIGTVYEYYLENDNKANKETFQKLISKIMWATRKLIIDQQEDNRINIKYDLTYRCNMQCLHCFVNDFPDMKELNLRQWINISEKILSCLSYKPQICISGGEPLLLSDMLKELISYLKPRTAGISLLTNGYIFADWIINEDYENLNFYMENVSDYQISLDGFDEKTHDKLRGKGSFEKVLSTLLYLNKHNKKTGIHTTVSRLNSQSIIDSFIHFLQKYDLYNNNNHFSFSSCKPVGRGLELENQGYLLGYVEYEKFLFAIYKQLVDKILGKPKDNPPEVKTNCGVGKQIIISPNGDCYLCGIPASEIIGNILEEDFRSIQEKLVLYRRNLDQENFELCYDCELKGLCRGGCRVMHKVKTGHYTIPYCTEDVKESIYRQLVRQELLGVGL